MDGPSGGTPHPRVPDMNDVELKGSRVLVRVDINAPVEDGRVTGTARLEAASGSIETLVDRGAGVVVLGHQGRPGRGDFTSLEQHADLIGDAIDRDVSFVPEIEGTGVLDAVEDVDPGEVLVLENVRDASGEIENLPAEEHAERDWVRFLAGEADAYVLDGFSVAHRSHASIVGFPLLLPACTGPVMQRELDALHRVEAPSADEERVLILGGVKIDDALRVIEHHLEEGLADRVLTGGLVAEAFLSARGHSLGGPTEGVLSRHHVPEQMDRVVRLLEDHDRAIVTPEDVAYDHNGRRELLVDQLPVEAGPILDVGPATVEAYTEEIEGADTVILNGPLGAYDKKEGDFAYGTEGVLSACVDADAFTLVGGGHTVTAMEKGGWSRSDFDHVSLAGGALVTYLTGDPLPGMAALAESARKFALGTGP